MSLGSFKNAINNFFYKSYISNIRGAYDTFPDFFVQAFKIVVDSWKYPYDQFL